MANFDGINGGLPQDVNLNLPARANGPGQRLQRQPRGNRARRPRQPNDEKSKALNFLEQTVAVASHVDGRRRFVMVGNGDQSQGLFTQSQLAALFRPDRVAHANQQLASKLAALQNLPLNRQDKKHLNTIFTRINSGNATAGDIVKLGRLVQRTQLRRNPQKLAFKRLKAFEAAAKAAGPNKSVTWSDEKVDIDFRDRTWMTKKGRMAAAAYMKAELAPLAQLLRQKGTNADQRKLDAYLKMIETGVMNSSNMIDLARLVSRVHNPKAYARETLARLNRMALLAGPDKSITWRDEKKDFKITNRRNMTKTGRQRAGSKMEKELDGLGELFRNANEAAKRSYRYHMKKIKKGKAKSNDIRSLEEIVKKQENPVGFACHELRRLCRKSVEAGANKSLTWRDNDMDVKITNRRWMTRQGRAMAKTVIDFRLDGLRLLFPENNLPLNQMARAILQKVEDGTAKSTDIIYLQLLVDTLQKLSHRNPQIANNAIIESLKYLEELESSPKSGEYVRLKLVALQEFVRRNHPESMGQFQGLLRQIANKNEDAAATIRELDRLVKNAYNNRNLQRVNNNNINQNAQNNQNNQVQVNLQQNGGIQNNQPDNNQPDINNDNNINNNDNNNLVNNQQQDVAFGNELHNNQFINEVEMSDIVEHIVTAGGRISGDDDSGNDAEDEFENNRIRGRRRLNIGEVSRESLVSNKSGASSSSKRNLLNKNLNQNLRRPLLSPIPSNHERDLNQFPINHQVNNLHNRNPELSMMVNAEDVGTSSDDSDLDAPITIGAGSVEDNNVNEENDGSGDIDLVAGNNVNEDNGPDNELK